MWVVERQQCTFKYHPRVSLLVDILFMHEEIQKLNEWLESQAIAWENSAKNNPYLHDTSWPHYYRGLKNLHEQAVFMISSVHFHDELSEYLTRHKEEYSFEGHTGYCIYTKK